MKKTMFIILCSAFASVAIAQNTPANIRGFKVAGGINVAIPANNLKSYSIGVGADLLAQYGISNSFGITGDVGYTTLFPNDKGKAAGVRDLQIFPIRLGLRYYPSSAFYVGAKAGLGLLSDKGLDNQNRTLTYSFGGGFMASPKLDLGLTYDGYTNNGASGIGNFNDNSLGIVNLRLGYFFGK
jgi:hypothetical protein